MSVEYTIVDRVTLNKWDEALQRAVEGWQIRARWVSTGTVLTVFVPLASYNAVEVDAAIRQAGDLDQQIDALGGSSS